MKKTTIVKLALSLFPFFQGCTLVTDFDEDRLNKGSDTDSNDTELSPGLYSLNDNLVDPVVVSLKFNPMATITLDLSEAVPESPEGDQAIAELIGDTIELVVENVDTGVTVNLTDGRFADGGPTKPGEYIVTLGEDRNQVNVQFINEVDGHTLRVGGNYQAEITVFENNYFIQEIVTRDVTVVQ